MKKIAIMSILVLMLAFAAMDVSALSAADTLQLGDEDGRASNPEANDEEDRDFFETKTFVLTNDHTSAVSNLGVTVTPKGEFSAQDLLVNVTFSETENIAAGATVTVTVRARIPGKLDAVDSSLKETAFSVADLKFTASAGADKTVDLKMQRENQLFIKDLDVCRNSDNDCESADQDGDDVKDLRPGDDIILIFEVENKYSEGDQEDLEIQDVELEWEIDEDDIDESETIDFDDIGPKDEEREEDGFDIPDDAGDGNYKMEIKLEGEDENGARHGETFSIDLELEKNSHEIDIRSYSVSPSKLSCDDLTTTVNVRLTNIGKRDEENVAFEVVNNELGIQERQDGLSLDEGRSMEVTERVKFEDDTKPGEYRISLKSFFSGTAQTDEESVLITVPECDGSSTSTSTTTTPTGASAASTARERQLEEQLQQLLAQRQQNQQRVTTQPTSTTDEGSFALDDAWVIALMGVAAFFLLIVLVVLLVKIFRR